MNNITVASVVTTTPTGLNSVIQGILTQQNPVIGFATAGSLIGYPTPAASYTARARGQFPLRVRKNGGKLVVFSSDLIEYLQTGESQASLSVEPIKKSWHVKIGRPSKRESIVAAELNISVSSLRAQSKIERVI